MYESKIFYFGQRTHHNDHRACPPYPWASNEDTSSSNDSDEKEYFSPCLSYFNTRYAIGTHSAKRENVELFTSKHENFRYVSKPS